MAGWLCFFRTECKFEWYVCVQDKAFEGEIRGRAQRSGAFGAGNIAETAGDERETQWDGGRDPPAAVAFTTTRAGDKRPHPGNRRYDDTVLFVHTH